MISVECLLSNPSKVISIKWKICSRKNKHNKFQVHPLIAQYLLGFNYWLNWRHLQSATDSNQKRTENSSDSLKIWNCIELIQVVSNRIVDLDDEAFEERSLDWIPELLHGPEKWSFKLFNDLSLYRSSLFCRAQNCAETVADCLFDRFPDVIYASILTTIE